MGWNNHLLGWSQVESNSGTGKCIKVLLNVYLTGYILRTAPILKYIEHLNFFFYYPPKLKTYIDL